MDKYNVNQPIRLKKGVYKLNEERNFDYQLNRVINWDGGRIEDVQPIADRIRTSADWKRELLAIGDTAMQENRIQNAIAYYRMSEFFMYDGDPDKKAYYEKATRLFYQYYADYFEGENARIEKKEVPYENVKLPVMHVVPDGKSKGTILLHGGNDSYFEEFLFTVLYLQEQGFEVYMFEGPGQGGVMRLQGMHFTHEWEKPAIQKMFYLFMKLHARPLINFVFSKKAKKEPVIDWGIKHGCYAYEAKDAYGYVQKLKLYDLEPIADKITQDVLIVGANQDHFIDYRLIGREINMLTNTKSLTFRLFTDKEDAQNHCNVGNGKIVLDTICGWIERIDAEVAEI